MKYNNEVMHEGLVSETDQAVFIFRTLFQEYTSDMLTMGILNWLSKISNETLQIFLSVPELFEGEYSLDDFLEGRVALPDASEQTDYGLIGGAVLMFTLVGECWDLFGEKLHNNPDGEWPISKGQADSLDQIQGLLEMIRLYEIQHRLALSIRATTGDDYYDSFLQKVAKVDNGINKEEAAAFENDPILKEHMSLMLWWGHMRLFLDATSFYFGEKKTGKARAGKAKKK